MTRNLAFLTEIVSLAKDPQWADSREMLVLALGRSRAPAVINVLLELLDDPSPGIVCYAMKALKRNAMPVALPQIIAVGQRTTDPYVMEEAGKIWVASDRRRLRQEFDPVVMAKLSASQLK